MKTVLLQFGIECKAFGMDMCVCFGIKIVQQNQIKCVIWNCLCEKSKNAFWISTTKRLLKIEFLCSFPMIWIYNKMYF